MPRNQITKAGGETTPNDPLHSHSTLIIEDRTQNLGEPTIRDTTHLIPYPPITTEPYPWICQGPGPLLLSNLGEDHHKEHIIA